MNPITEIQKRNVSTFYPINFEHKWVFQNVYIAKQIKPKSPLLETIRYLRGSS